MVMDVVSITTKLTCMVIFWGIQYKHTYKQASKTCIDTVQIKDKKNIVNDKRKQR